MKINTFILLFLALFFMHSLSPAYATTETKPSSENSSPPQALEEDIQENLFSRFFGKSHAPIIIEEFFSYTCEACKIFHEQVFPEINQTFIQTEKVLFIFHPLPLNQFDLAASLIGACLPHTNFKTYIDLIFQSQQELLKQEKPYNSLKKITFLIGLSPNAFDTCLKNEKILTNLNQHIQKNTRTYNISGTPFIVINGQKVAPTRKAIFKTIHQLLKDTPGYS